jgi:formate dehydrogenase major subunit
MHQKNALLTPSAVSFVLNGETVVCGSGETILEAAEKHGVDIPRLCYMEGMRPDGNCRTCMVEIKGERVLAPSCCRYPKEGMEVTSNSARALISQKMSIELLLSDVSETAYTLNSELDLWAKNLSSRQAPLRRAPSAAARSFASCHGGEPRRLHSVQTVRSGLPRRAGQRRDRVRLPWRTLQDRVRISDDPMGDSTCVACGECVQACPTGALMPARDVGQIVAEKQVDSVCPYCGVGCQLTYNIKDNNILYVNGKDGPANSSRLCVKGRYGFDYVQHKHRLPSL